MTTAFIDRLLPAPRDGGFAMDNFWVWDGSIIRGEDGRYHLFAARWPGEYPFLWGYLFLSHIVRAVSDRPEGPYQFQEVIFPPRGEAYWDGRMTHQPEIRKCGDTYVLFYIGATFTGEIPSPEEMRNPSLQPRVHRIYLDTRIGIATSKSIFGPWQRRDEPILHPRPDRWDAHNTTNPAPWVHEDGRVVMVYRSNHDGRKLGGLLGVATADHYSKPFRRLYDEPVLFQDDEIKNRCGVEDPYIWWNGREYELLLKDLVGTLAGEQYAGIHARSTNGIEWTLCQPPKAYSRTVRWNDGTQTMQSLVDGPSLLFEDGVPTHLMLATTNGAPGRPSTRTWDIVLPLKH